MIYLLYLASFIPSVHLRNLLYDTKAVRCYQLNLCLPSYPSLSIICLSSPHHCTPHFVQSFYPLTFAHPIIFFLPFIPLPLPTHLIFFYPLTTAYPLIFFHPFIPLPLPTSPFLGSGPGGADALLNRGKNSVRTYVRTSVRPYVPPPSRSPRLRGPWA